MAERDNPGPYVRAAVLCKDVTTESAGQVNGFVGLLDQIVLPADPASTPTGYLRVETKVVVQLVAGAARGKRAVVKFETEDPTGIRTEGGGLPVEFLAEESSVVTIQIDYEIDVVNEGVHWLEVYIVPDTHARTRLVTRIPLSISYG